MRKLLILSITCLMALCTMAQEINAVKVTQGETTDWYPFGESDRIDVTITNGNPMFPNKTYDLANGNVETEFGTAPAEKITLTAADFTVTKDGDWVYDKTEKRVNVELLNPEYIMPSADKITIYYNNDKMVKPINPGTYQVYIDIEETDIYAAVTGITSEAWKFDIIDPLPPIKEAAIDAVKAAQDVANEEIDLVAEGYEDVEIVLEQITNAKFYLEEIEYNAINAINNATDEDAVNAAKDNAIVEIDETKETYKNYIQGAITLFKELAISDVNNTASAAKEEIDGLGVDESAKSDAKAEIDNIAHTAEQTINAAISKDAIDNAKTEAIAKIHDVVLTTKNMWVTVRTDGVADNWNTICLERNITAIDGATFWTVSGQDANSFVLDQVTEPQAGYGYLILFTAAELKVKYGSETAASPVTADDGNPIQGTYTQIDFDQDGQNELVGNYVVYQNQLCKVEAWERLLAHRAYVVTNHVPDNAPDPTPGRARTSIPKQKETPTELEMVDDAQCTMHDGKFLRNGQLIIVREGKTYNAQGMRL